MPQPGGDAPTPASKAPGSLLKSEAAYEAIRQRILEGVYPSGHRLVLDQVARDLSISPVPVREAVRRLEAEGYVVVRRNAGAQVASIGHGEYEQVMEVLAVLEAAATALTAPQVTDDDLAAARRANEALRAGLGTEDLRAFFRLNRAFHAILYARCPNAHLVEFIDREWQRMVAIRPTGFTYRPERARAAVREHEQLLRLIASKAPAATIEALCRGHRMTSPASLDALESKRQAVAEPQG